MPAERIGWWDVQILPDRRLCQLPADVIYRVYHVPLLASRRSGPRAEEDGGKEAYVGLTGQGSPNGVPARWCSKKHASLVFHPRTGCCRRALQGLPRRTLRRRSLQQVKELILRYHQRFSGESCEAHAGLRFLDELLRSLRWRRRSQRQRIGSGNDLDLRKSLY